MKKIKQQKKEPFLSSFLKIIIGVDVILLIANIAVLYFLPLKAENIQKVSSELMAQKISQQNYQKTMVDLENIQTKKEIIEKSFPNAESIVDFIDLINKIEKSADLKIFTFDSDMPLKDANGNAYLPLTLVIEDSWPKILNSLNLLQKSPYFFRSQKFTLTSPDIEDKEVRAEFNLFIYVDQDFEELNEKN